MPRRPRLCASSLEDQSFHTSATSPRSHSGRHVVIQRRGIEKHVKNKVNAVKCRTYRKVAKMKNEEEINDLNELEKENLRVRSLEDELTKQLKDMRETYQDFVRNGQLVFQRQAEAPLTPPHSFCSSPTHPPTLTNEDVTLPTPPSSANSSPTHAPSPQPSRPLHTISIPADTMAEWAIENIESIEVDSSMYEISEDMISVHYVSYQQF